MVDTVEHWDLLDDAAWSPTGVAVCAVTYLRSGKRVLASMRRDFVCHRTDEALRGAQAEARRRYRLQLGKSVLAAIDEAVPTPVPSAALHARFASRGEAGFANQVLAALRHEFSRHAERPAVDAR
jgi:hypothetical protein